MSKSAELNDRNNSPNDKSQRIEQETSRISSTSALQTDQTNAIKMPQNIPEVVQRKRSGSVCSVSVIHLDKSSIEMQQITDQKKKTTNGVTVKKLSRNPAANKSHNS